MTQDLYTCTNLLWGRCVTRSTDSSKISRSTVCVKILITSPRVCDSVTATSWFTYTPSGPSNWLTARTVSRAEAVSMGMRARQLLSISIVAAGRPSASWCVAGVLQCVAVCCKCVAVCYSVLRCSNGNEGETVAKRFHRGGGAPVRELFVLQVCCRCVAVCYSVLQCVAVCCSVSVGIRARQSVNHFVVAARGPSATQCVADVS